MRRSISVKKTMTIEKGEDWGHRALFPDDAPIVDGDAELAALFRSQQMTRTTRLSRAPVSLG